MKFILICLSFLATSAFAYESFQAQTTRPDSSSQLVPIQADEIYAPDGFDDNDEAQVVVDGFLPSSCYRLSKHEINIDQQTGAIRVVQMARFFPDSICLPVQVPYWQVIDLGVLPARTFSVETLGAQSKSLQIAEATNAGPDDHAYAPVDSASVERDLNEGTYTAILKGRFPNSCMSFQELRVLATGTSIEVLPIVNNSSDRCEAADVAFEQRVALPEDLDPRRYLLHVRSLNGKAVNHMFTVEP